MKGHSACDKDLYDISGMIMRFYYKNNCPKYVILLDTPVTKSVCFSALAMLLDYPLVAPYQ